VSGARPDRRELQRMLKSLATGDVVTVTRIDRLARSTFSGIAQMERRHPVRRDPGRAARDDPLADRV
jgi:DNA invertase Pin-like site-specific DNA recombinase